MALIKPAVILIVEDDHYLADLLKPFNQRELQLAIELAIRRHHLDEQRELG